MRVGDIVFTQKKVQHGFGRGTALLFAVLFKVSGKDRENHDVVDTEILVLGKARSSGDNDNDDYYRANELVSPLSGQGHREKTYSANPV